MYRPPGKGRGEVGDCPPGVALPLFEFAGNVPSAKRDGSSS